MLAAAEARLRSQREQSIAGRNAAASRAAQQASESPEARARAARATSGATSAAAAATAAAGSVLGEQEQSRTSARPFTSTTPSSRKFSFGKEAAKGSGGSEDKDEEQQETASGSGGRVAEIRRRGAAPNNENQEGKGKDGQADRGHDWGQGRKLGE